MVIYDRLVTRLDSSRSVKQFLLDGGDCLLDGG